MICTECKHAVWERTKAGRLHPSGDGECTFEVEVRLPKAKYLIGGLALGGGLVNRRSDKWTECPCFEANESERKAG